MLTSTGSESFNWDPDNHSTRHSCHIRLVLTGKPYPSFAWEKKGAHLLSLFSTLPSWRFPLSIHLENIRRPYLQVEASPVFYIYGELPHSHFVAAYRCPYDRAWGEVRIIHRNPVVSGKFASDTCITLQKYTTSDHLRLSWLAYQKFVWVFSACVVTSFSAAAILAL